MFPPEGTGGNTESKRPHGPASAPAPQCPLAAPWRGCGEPLPPPPGGEGAQPSAGIRRRSDPSPRHHRGAARLRRRLTERPSRAWGCSAPARLRRLHGGGPLLRVGTRGCSRFAFEALIEQNCCFHVWQSVG